ncbi:MAG: exopolysaccharide Pel transporter PelG [Fervidobacterium sp.]
MRYFKYSISKGFIFAPNYDIPMFVSYLFIIPTLSLFVLNLETEFYYFYRSFYRSIEENRTLKFIRLSKANMDESVSSSSKLILSIQLTFALTGLILSKKLAQILLLDNYGLIALRFGIIGAAANGLFLYAILISYYFDLPEIPLKGSSIALSLNTVISIFTIQIFPGAGFTIGFIVATIYVFMAFNKIYSDILRLEFTRSKLNLPKREVIIHENK